MGSADRVTPLECARLRGFEERKIVVSDTQAYRQFGNAVVPKGCRGRRPAGHEDHVMETFPGRKPVPKSVEEPERAMRKIGA